MPDYHKSTIRSRLVNQTVSPDKLACLSDADINSTISPLLTAITLDTSGGNHFCLQTVPILTSLISPSDIDKSRKPMYHGYITALATEVSLYSFVIYSFNSGHFLSCTLTTTLPFEVVATADTRQCGRVLFKKLTNCPQITDSAPDLLQALTTDTATSTVHGYMIHTHSFLQHKTKHHFWSTQVVIVCLL